MIIAVDFDGTIVEHRYPHIGEPLPGAIETLKDLIAAGHKLILTTCREDNDRGDKKRLTEAVNFLSNHGITFIGINESPREYDFRDDCTLRRKVYAHIYIDDAIIGGFMGWDRVRAELL